MLIEIIGPWILLIVGVLMLGAGAVAVSRGKPPNKPWIWIIGLATSGTGVYGPTFLTPYAKLINPILAMQRSPGVETYTAVFDEVAKGTLDPEYQELALAYALDRPIDGMDDLLTSAIDSATDQDGKTALQQASEALQGKKMVSDRLIATLSVRTVPGDPTPWTTVDDLPGFDRSTLMFLAQQLLEQGAARFSEADLEKLAAYAKPRERRAKKDF